MRCARTGTWPRYGRGVRRLDDCIAVLAVQNRTDDAYYVDDRHTTQGNGLSLWDGTGRTHSC